jgi:hypothetical protein
VARVARKWCVVTHVAMRALMAYTENDELVLIPRTWHGMDAAGIGDVISVEPELNTRPAPANSQKAKWVGVHPRLIGKKFEPKPKTREGENALEWKARSDAELDKFRTRDFAPANTGHGPAGTEVR